SAGASHTCALTAVGGVKCWGFNSSGQLGDGTTVDRSAPVDVVGLTSGVRSVAAGGLMGAGPGIEHSCALTTTGEVKCWGSNYVGAIGDGRRCGGGTLYSCATPVGVSGLSSDVVAISAGNQNACALTSARALKCWGAWPGDDGACFYSWCPTPEDVVGLASG